MTGLSVHLFIQGRMQGGETQGNTLIAVFLALSFAREPARRGIPASMLMVFLSHGSIRPNTEQGFARMRLVALEKSASLLTNLKSCARCMLPPGRLCLRRNPIQLADLT